MEQGNPILYYRIKIKGKEGLLRCAEFEFENASLSFSKFLEEIVERNRSTFKNRHLDDDPTSFQLFRVFFYIFPQCLRVPFTKPCLHNCF